MAACAVPDSCLPFPLRSQAFRQTAPPGAGFSTDTGAPVCRFPCAPAACLPFPLRTQAFRQTGSPRPLRRRSLSAVSPAFAGFPTDRPPRPRSAPLLPPAPCFLSAVFPANAEETADCPFPARPLLLAAPPAPFPPPAPRRPARSSRSCPCSSAPRPGRLLPQGRLAASGGRFRWPLPIRFRWPFSFAFLCRRRGLWYPTRLHYFT